MSIRTLTVALILIAISAPAMAQGRACDRMHRDYENAEGPKAWAVGRDGCGYATARSASSLGEARRKAYEACSENGSSCRIVEEERR